MNVQIPVKWLQELLALCGPEDHELRERVMVSITAMDEQTARAVAMPEPDEQVKELMVLIGKYGSAVEANSTGNPSNYTLASDESAAYEAIKAKLRALLATGGQVREELPQAEGADYFVILDPEDGTVEFAYSADLGRDFGHEHIKDAQERDNESAHCWVVRPAYAAPQQADARDAEQERWMEIGKAIERACIDQPDSTEIVISLERDAGTVTMFDPDGNEHDQFSHEDGFSGVVNAAIEAAIAAAKGECQ